MKVIEYGDLCRETELECSEAEWDRFVFGHSDPHHEQSTGWARTRSEAGWSSGRVLVRTGQQITGCAQILERTYKGFLRVGYLSRGPLVADSYSMPKMVNALTLFAKKRHYSYFAVSLPYFAYELVPFLEAAGFCRRPIEMPPAVWVRSTLIFDLDKNEDALFLELRPDTRKQIRRGLRAGVVVREGDAEDLELFCELVGKLCQRRGVSSNMPGLVAMRKMWSSFAPSGNMRMFVAEFQGRPICAQIIMIVGQWARAWRIGWNGEDKMVYPTKVLYWHVLRWCNEHGCKHFDLLGIDERDAIELLNGRPRQNAFHCSITEFKVGLGGRILQLPGEWCYFPNKIHRWMFEIIGRRLLAGKLAKKLANRFHQVAVSQ